MDNESDIVNIWITKRDSFDINCDGITRDAIRIWFQKPKKSKSKYDFGWKNTHCNFISADFLGKKTSFPFTNAVWNAICESEIGHRDMWGEDDEHKHLLSSPNHYSNWLGKLKLKIAVLNEPNDLTIPIWFTKGVKRKDSLNEGTAIGGSMVWFLKKPHLQLQISDNNPVFPFLVNLTSLDELQDVSEELNESQWDHIGGGERRVVDYFFRNLPHSYEIIKKITRDDFKGTNPSSDWMTWCKQYYLYVEVLES